MIDKFGVIYKITNHITNELYVGKTERSLETRKKQHIRASKKYNTKLYNAFNKFGIENFSFDIIEQCKLVDLSAREVYWITEFDSFNTGYNMTIGGEGVSSYQMTEFSRHKMKISHIGERNGFYGKNHTDETKHIISTAIKKTRHLYKPFLNKKHTEESKQKSRSKLAKTYKIQLPDKSEIVVVGLKSFCKEHNLTLSNLLQNKHGHKGYFIIKNEV